MLQCVDGRNEAGQPHDLPGRRPVELEGCFFFFGGGGGLKGFIHATWNLQVKRILDLFVVL